MNVEMLARGDLEGFPILIGIIVVMAFIIYAGFQSNKHKATLRIVAQKMGGTFVDSTFGQPHLELKFGERQARLEYQGGGGESSSQCTKVVVKVGGRTPGMLHIMEEGFGQSFLKMFGAQDLEVGDPRFDSLYVLKATPATLVRQLFAPERRQEGMRIVRRLGSYISPTFDLDAQTVTVQVRQYLREESELLTLIESARDFTAFVLEPVAPPGIPGIVFGDIKIVSGSDCPVCGTAMTAQTVRCEACRTPHHAECWQYMGRCSTYACKGTRAA